MKVNWFPGHMAKTLRQLKEQSNRCDFVIETCDARIPNSSRNPEFAKIALHKKRLLLLNKADLADAKTTDAWISYYKSMNLSVYACNTANKASINGLKSLIIKENQELIERAKSRGRRGRPIRVMVIGIPNTGKSTLINRLTGKQSANTSNRPGVTRSLNWLRAGNELELLDSPGTLWPNLSDPLGNINLAATGAIKDDLLPLDKTAAALLLILSQLYPKALLDKYQIDESYYKFFANDIYTWRDAFSLLEIVATNKKLLLPGGDLNISRAATMVINDFRNKRLGAISLEYPGKDIKIPQDL